MHHDHEISDPRPLPLLADAQAGHMRTILQVPLLHDTSWDAPRHTQVLGAETARQARALTAGCSRPRRVRYRERAHPHLALSKLGRADANAEEGRGRRSLAAGQWQQPAHVDDQDPHALGLLANAVGSVSEHRGRVSARCTNCPPVFAYVNTSLSIGGTCQSCLRLSKYLR